MPYSPWLNRIQRFLYDVSEPYLLQIGFLQRTPRGRVATDHAYAHLGLSKEPGHPKLL